MNEDMRREADTERLKCMTDGMMKLRAGLNDAEERLKETQTAFDLACAGQAKAIGQAQDAERRAEEHCCELETQDFRLQNDWEWKTKVDYQKDRVTKITRERDAALSGIVVSEERTQKAEQRAEKTERELKEVLAGWDRCCCCNECAARYERLSGEPHRKDEIEKLKEEIRIIQGMEAKNAELIEERNGLAKNIVELSAQNAELRAALESLAADVRRWNTQDPMPDMSGKHKGWRFPQLEVYVERALKFDG